MSSTPSSEDEVWLTDEAETREAASQRELASSGEPEAKAVELINVTVEPVREAGSPEPDALTNDHRERSSQATTQPSSPTSAMSDEEKSFPPDEQLLLRAIRGFKALDSTEIQGLVRRHWQWPRIEAALLGLYEKRLIYATAVRKGNRWIVVWKPGSVLDAIKAGELVAVSEAASRRSAPTLPDLNT